MQEQEVDEAAATLGHAAVALANAGVQRELARGLGVLTGEEDEDPALLLLSWGLLLATLLSHTPLSRVRTQLSQAMLDMDR